MAGRGSRFRKVGISKPKHEIVVRGEPMFDWAMRSLNEFFEEDFIFVTQKEHQSTAFLEKACERLGISNYEEITLDGYTDGQASTAVCADSKIHAEESVAIYNIDTYIEGGILSPNHLDSDGVIPVFIADGERWSFVREEDGLVVDVSEKNKISNNATAGFYYFDRWRDFINAFNSQSGSVEDEYGETYIAPLYNYLIENDKEIRTHEIAKDAVHVLGTPDDLRKFDNNFGSERPKQ